VHFLKVCVCPGRAFLGSKFRFLVNAFADHYRGSLQFFAQRGSLFGGGKTGFEKIFCQFHIFIRPGQEENSSAKDDEKDCGKQAAQYFFTPTWITYWVTGVIC